MKKSLTLLLLSVTLLSFAQQESKNTNATASIPNGYYNGATGTGYVLKTQLFNIIKNHFDQGYNGLYTTYQTSDVRSNGTVWDMYSDCPFIFGTVANGGNQDNGTNPSGECALFNREHTIPQSYFGNGVQPMYSDAHFVLPADKVVNAKRDDYPYGVVQNPTWTSTNGSKLGPNLNSGYSAGYSSTVFEPVDQYKGDIARLLFYFVTRYEDQLTTFYSSSSTVKAMFDGTSNHSFSNTFLNILLTWNNQDPVSAKEIARNNAIYARQNNRNPFIDHPEYVCQIWGAACAALNNQNFSLTNSVKVYPNPTNNGTVTISCETTVDSIELITINGQIIQQIKNPEFQDNTFTITNLPNGFYFLKLSGNGESLTKKVLVN
ncbi:T9SS type A sorting domain-containing protein [Flavobacterium silvisoli]|uniref:T9SS type A sorting domain-containing protein n=1 Tax=Flavobacterium silvisoli TaxID=2529433 RepID=A0A4Q9YSZ6_9FLAO|nr:endonuclease [Flavobacterium silvisoli]TBX66647.1 T9SS type A sorting domain-containing protein [Flavobacterium silvisoli]